MLGDAVLIANYLINCMPSTNLGGKSPHSRLFSQESLFYLPSHMFILLVCILA